MSEAIGRRLDGAVAIVTGAGRGIGRATAARLVAEDASVVVADLDGARAEAAAAVLGPAASALAADVGVEADVDAMVLAAEERLGPVDVLVNDAAICRAYGLEDTTRAAWDAELAVDLTGPFLCCRRVLPDMIARGGGAIVNVSTVNALGWYGKRGPTAPRRRD